jgi:hypothetical protein
MSVIWGIPCLMIKVAVEGMPVPVLVFARTAVGAAVLLPLVLRGPGSRGCAGTGDRYSPSLQQRRTGPAGQSGRPAVVGVSAARSASSREVLVNAAVCPRRQASWPRAADAAGRDLLVPGSRCGPR